MANGRNKLIILVICICMVVSAAMVGSYVVVVLNADSRTFDDVGSVPYSKVGLLLATSPITSGGAHNYYFDNRIKAVDELYKAGKIDFVIASGDDYTHTQKMAAMNLKPF